MLLVSQLVPLRRLQQHLLPSKLSAGKEGSSCISHMPPDARRQSPLLPLACLFAIKTLHIFMLLRWQEIAQYFV